MQKKSVKNLMSIQKPVNATLECLKKHDLIGQESFGKKQGYEYTVKVWNDYSAIEDGIDLLDQTLKELREKYPTA